MLFTLFTLLAALQIPHQAGNDVPSSPGHRVRVLDLTGDGAPDLLTQRPDGSLQVSVHAGGRAYLPVPQQLPAVDLVDVLADDLDGDGILDLYLVCRGGNFALLGDGTGRFVDATSQLGLEDVAAGVRVERPDLDGDGLADVLLTNSDSQVIFWAELNGTYRRSLDTPAAATVSQPAAGPTATPMSGWSSAAQALWLDVLDARYVNDDQGEVDSLDVSPFSLSGEQVSTQTGNVSFLGGRVGVGTSSPEANLHVRGGPQWSSWNYGASLLVSGTHNNAIGILDHTGGHPVAIANAGGELTFAKMPALGDVSTAPQRRMVLDDSGATIFGEVAASAGVRFADGSLLTSASEVQGPPGPPGPQGAPGTAGGLAIQFQGEKAPDVAPSMVGALWIDTDGEDDPELWDVYIGFGTDSVLQWIDLFN